MFELFKNRISRSHPYIRYSAYLDFIVSFQLFGQEISGVVVGGHQELAVLFVRRVGAVDERVALAAQLDAVAVGATRG